MVFSVISMRKTTVQGWKRGNGGFLHTGSSALLLWQVVPGVTYLKPIGNRIIYVCPHYECLYRRVFTSCRQLSQLFFPRCWSRDMRSSIYLSKDHSPLSPYECNYFLNMPIYTPYTTFSPFIHIKHFSYSVYCFYFNVFAHVTVLFSWTVPLFITDISSSPASVLSNIYVHSCVTYCTFPFCCISIFSPFTCMYNIFFMYLINFLTFWISNL